MTAWVDREFERHDFTDEDLVGLSTERVVFTECNFSGANLAESRHRASAFRNCTFRRTSLWHSTFEQCTMLGSVFEQCRLRPVTFDEVDFTSTRPSPSRWRTGCGWTAGTARSLLN